jgi:predicted enzyme related to lactoylglutathione lyase
VTLALVDPETAGQPFQPLPFAAIVLRVDDVDEAKAKLQSEGIEFLGETFDSGVCNGAAFRDPDGNGLMLHHRYAPYRDGSLP